MPTYVVVYMEEEKEYCYHFSKTHRKEYRKPFPIFKIIKGGKTYGQCRSKIIL